MIENNEKARSWMDIIFLLRYILNIYSTCLMEVILDLLKTVPMIVWKHNQGTKKPPALHRGHNVYVCKFSYNFIIFLKPLPDSFMLYLVIGSNDSKIPLVLWHRQVHFLSNVDEPGIVMQWIKIIRPSCDVWHISIV